MRRIMLLTVASVWVVGMLTVMGRGVAIQNVQTETTAPRRQVITFPCEVMDTQMMAQMMAYYEGPFRENGSNEEVAGIAALVVENVGGTMISEGAVIVDWGDEILVFEVFGLPAGARALVLEKDQKLWTDQKMTGCYGWERREYPENMGQVTVTDVGGCTMLVTNETDSYVAAVRIRYKSYHAEGDMYIGGICYETVVESLAPGEQREISPYHYVCGNSKVVSVIMETEGKNKPRCGCTSAFTVHEQQKRHYIAAVCFS